MEHVIQHVYYHCRPGMAETFIGTIRSEGLQTRIRAEEGCLQYDYNLSREEDDLVVLLEMWESDAHLQAHMQRPTMTRLNEIKAACLDQVRIEKYRAQRM